MHAALVFVIVVTVIYIAYYSLVLAINKQYREYVATKHSINVAMAYIALVTLAVVITIGIHLITTSDAMLSRGRQAFVWIVAFLAFAACAVMAASSIYTQVKLKKNEVPEGAHTTCPLLNIFVEPSSKL